MRAALALPTTRPSLLGAGTRRTLAIAMCEDDSVDNLVIIGDAGALFIYGTVQAVVDVILAPFAAADPEMFTNDLPLEMPLAQGSLLALVWIGLTYFSGGYKWSRSREFPQSLLSSAVTWIACSALLLGALALLASVGIGPGASQAEMDFFFGSLTVVGGWRLVYANLPR